MGLETVTYISDLVATNPVGSSDPKSQGDDHIRNIKAALLATFPAITGAVLPTHTELNYLDGATGVTGTGSTVRSASPTFTGTAAFATITATSGAGISALNASNLASGTIPDARFPSTLPALSGANLGSLNASNIGSGALADARLSANVPLLNLANSFSANQTITLAGETALFVHNSLNNSTDRAEVIFQTNSTVRAYVGVGDLITGAGRADIVLRAAAGGLFFSGNAGSTAHFALSSAGVLTTPNASASEVGYKGVPVNSQAGSYTLVLADAGKKIQYTGSGGHTFTIPANASVAYPVGTVLVFAHFGGTSTTVSIAITSDAMYLAGTNYGTSGTRTLASGSVATATKENATNWIISGAGLT